MEIWLYAWCQSDDDIKLEVSTDGGTAFLSTITVLDVATSKTEYWVDLTGWTTWTVDKINGDKIWTRVTHVKVGIIDVVYLDHIPIMVSYKPPTTITVDTAPKTVNKIGSETTKISGTLRGWVGGLWGETVKLYYQYASTPSGTPPVGGWNYIASDTTDTDGKYEYDWNPDDTLPNGYYWIKAVFEGDDDWSGSSATTGVNTIPNLFVVPEVPLGTIAALASMMLAFAAVMLHKRPRLPLT